MRFALFATLCLLATVTLVAAADAKPIVVGDCSKSGACVGVCVAPDCGPGRLACVGISYQVPQCVPDPGVIAAGSALPCSVGADIERPDIVLRCGITVCHVNLDDIVRCVY